MTVIYRTANGYIVRKTWGCMSSEEIPTVHVFETLSGVATFLNEEYGDHPDVMAANHIKPKRRKR